MISIIIPSYNRENTIVRSIMSILNQTINDLEVIVVDDASKDNTVEIINGIRDERIKLIVLDENVGACEARNIGIRSAKGEYIAFQDSDDEWYSEKLEEQIRYIEDNKLDIVFCSMDLYNEEGIKLGVFPKEEQISNPLCVKYSELLRQNLISTQTLIGKSECFFDIHFDNTLPSLQDWDLVLRLSKKYSIGYINKILVRQYLQYDSITRNHLKRVKGLDIILKKNQDEYQKDRVAFSMYWDFLGCESLLCNNYDLARIAFIKSLKCSFNIKVFLKFILGMLRVYKPKEK